MQVVLKHVKTGDQTPISKILAAEGQQHGRRHGGHEGVRSRIHWTLVGCMMVHDMYVIVFLIHTRRTFRSFLEPLLDCWAR